MGRIKLIALFALLLTTQLFAQVALPGVPFSTALGPYTLFESRPSSRSLSLAQAADPTGNDAAALETNPAMLARMENLGVWANFTWTRPNLGFTSADHGAQLNITGAGSAGKLGDFVLSFWYNRSLSSDFDLKSIPLLLDTLHFDGLLRTRAFVNEFGLAGAWSPIPLFSVGATANLGYFSETGLFPTLLLSYPTLPSTEDFNRTGYAFSARFGLALFPLPKVRLGACVGLPMSFSVDEQWGFTDPTGFRLGTYGTTGRLRLPLYVDLGAAVGPLLGWEFSGAVRYDNRARFANSSESPDFLSFYGPAPDEVSYALGLQSGLLLDYVTLQAGYAYVQPLNENGADPNARIRQRYGLGLEAGLFGVHLGLGAGYERSRTELQLLEKLEVGLGVRWEGL